jgi:hypothetical protein
LLSKASDDPSLKDKTVLTKMDTVAKEVVKREEVKKDEPKKEEVKKEPVQTVSKQEPVKTDDPKTGIGEPKNITTTETVNKVNPPTTTIRDTANILPNGSKPVVEEPYKRSVVTKRSESSTTEGFGAVYTDDMRNGSMDTIRIFIPNPKPVVDPVKEEPKVEKKFLDIGGDTTAKQVATPKDEVVKEKITNVDTATILIPLENTSCKALATETDFFKLRKQMAAKIEDDEMIIVAKSFFKTKCFTVTQIKNLSTLFLNDEGKYKFFDAAYPYAWDSSKFPSLESELKFTYYINRFRAMLK